MQERITSAVTSRNKESCGKWHCHAVWHQADSATAMEHVIPHQLRNSVFCWVCSKALLFNTLRVQWLEASSEAAVR
jgi:hypothetical protein